MEFEHRVIVPDTQLLTQGIIGGGFDGSWFKKYVFNQIPDMVMLAGAKLAENVSQLDLRIVRGTIASMLREACNPEDFFGDNAGLEPVANEDDRLAAIEYLSFISTVFGLLTSDEVEQIKRTEGRLPMSRFVENKPVNLLGEDKLLQQINEWKNQGFSIGEYQMSGDPPNPTHLFVLTQSYLWARKNSIKMKLLVGLDSNELLRLRKQSLDDPRPRMDIGKRREIFESFWMVDATYVINPPLNDWKNGSWWSGDYMKHQTDLVFITENQDDKESRVVRIKQGGATPVELVPLGSRVSSTDLANAVRRKL